MPEKKEIAIGGQAVIEGVMMRGPELLATAIRRKDGTIELKKQPFISITKKIKILGIPILRGFVSLIEMLKIGISTLAFSAERWELDLELDEKAREKQLAAKNSIKTKVMDFLNYALAFGLAIVLMGLLPYKISDWLKFSDRDFYFNIVAGIIRILFFLTYVWLISYIKDIKRVFRYHGAEHKNVSAYENNCELQVPRIQQFSTIHPRCGTSFMFLVFMISILVFSITDTLVSIYILGKPVPFFIRFGYHFLLIPFVSGISYELLKLSAKRTDNFLVKLIITPGMALQRITTQAPDDDMVETGLVAMKAALGIDYSEHNVKVLD